MSFCGCKKHETEFANIYEERKMAPYGLPAPMAVCPNAESLFFYDGKRGPSFRGWSCRGKLVRWGLIFDQGLNVFLSAFEKRCLHESPAGRIVFKPVPFYLLTHCYVIHFIFTIYLLFYYHLFIFYFSFFYYFFIKKKAKLGGDGILKGLHLLLTRV